MTELTPDDSKDELQQIRIIFMGTPDFALASLETLVNAGCIVAGVVTSPDKPAGRGLKMYESPVKKYARQKGLIVLQPEKLKNEVFLHELKLLNADLQIVVAFRMLPEVVWEMPPMGTINLHASLLPQYRGAAPINWAIINGEKETGITTFKLKQEIDMGNILLQEKMEIGDEDNASDLHDRMKIRGANLLLRTVKGLADGSLEEISQSAMLMEKHEIHHLRSAPKIFTETCKIDWGKSVDENYNLIRGLSTYPGAFTYLDGKLFKIFRCEKDKSSVTVSRPYETDGKNYLKFRCADGYIAAKEIQLEGKKKLMIEEFLRGWRSANDQ